MGTPARGWDGETTRRQQIHRLSKGVVQVGKPTLEALEPVFHPPAQIAVLFPQPFAFLYCCFLIGVERVRKRFESGARRVLNMVVADKVRENDIEEIFADAGSVRLAFGNSGFPQCRNQKLEIDRVNRKPERGKLLGNGTC